jgi:hypothetical protein
MSVEITDEMVRAAEAAGAGMAGDPDMRAALEAAAPAIQAAVAYRIAQKLAVVATEKAQADNMPAHYAFSEAAGIARSFAKDPEVTR